MRASASTTDVVRSALDAFNDGDGHALDPAPPGDGAPGRSRPTSQSLLGCSPCRTCVGRRAMPVAAGENAVSLIGIQEVGAGRAVCNLATADGSRLVGLYAIDAGRIAAACHYLSDVETLTELGILPLAGDVGATGDPAAPSASADHDVRGALSVGEELRGLRLAQRRRRLRLAIHELDVRVDALSGGGHPIPRGLTVAIREFQRELDDVLASAPAAQAPSRGGAGVYPGTTFVGSCATCRELVFDRDPHAWEHEGTHRPCLPLDDGAALYCGRCSHRRSA